MQITPIPCLTDNYAYIISDSNSKIVGAVSYTHLTLPTTPYV